MGTFREEGKAELQRIRNSRDGSRQIIEMYEQMTGKTLSGITVHIDALIPELLDRHVADSEAALVLKDFLPVPELIGKMSPGDVGLCLLRFFETVVEKNQHRSAIKRDYIGGSFPVQHYPARFQAPVSKILLEGWDWLVSQNLIARENKLDSYVLTRRGEEFLKRAKEKQGQFIIFYSWQSDLPPTRNQLFIQECIEDAISVLAAEGVQLVPSLDRDTQGEPGAPDIAETILAKIDNCDMFICDVSIVTRAESARACPNPNVMLELGYAAKRLDWGRITNVFNLAYGSVEEVPFDLRHRRIIKYSLQSGENKTSAKKALVEAFILQIKACVEMGKAPTA
jgi:DNA-binding PadR family transcriptional regulator